ncbi:MAG TPA: hypothetical protein VFI43_01050 [Nitrosospira sp.]|nr:hypothetical protein [Nitrosospira sp.]
MKLIVLSIFMVLHAAAWAIDTSPIFEELDAETKFKDAQLHVKKLMDTGQYQEASKYMPVYQRLACEAAEQKAGRAPADGSANCARRQNQGGINASVLQRQKELFSSAPASSGTAVPGVTVMTRPVTGSPTMLDSSAPSLLMFDPRNTPGTSSSESRPEPPVDPWTGKR